jgi:hypothetical protein
LTIIVQASRSKGACLLAHLCFFWFNVWTFMRSPFYDLSIFCISMFSLQFDVLFLMHNAFLKMLLYEHVNIFGHSNLQMTETWCWTLCSKVGYWYHVFLAEQSYVEWFFRADTLLAFANFLFFLLFFDEFLFFFSTSRIKIQVK